MRRVSCSRLRYCNEVSIANVEGASIAMSDGSARH